MGALDIVRRPKTTPIHELERRMRCKDCSQVRGYPYKRSHLVVLRPTRISASDAAARRRLSQRAEHSPGRARDHRAELDATGEIAHCKIVHRHVNPTPVSRDYT
jgi:hypothetical protein